MKIDLCCGTNCATGYQGLDYKKYNTKVKYICNLEKQSLPFKNNSIDEFRESNSLYELSNPFEIIKECYRCLKPNGTLTIYEMHFSSQYAYTPYTKNFWAFNTTRLFSEGYRQNYGWVIKEVDFETGFEHSHKNLSKVFKWLINLNRNFYEKHFSRIFPIFRVKIVLQKGG